ncbi:YeeE/YedE family protein [Aquabacterium sp. J223]|uniref:YeeE/YedE family protein n=1 Tax=Aquabacterium sp. J223 TaxID=2898431 RepID=UPI0021AD82D8|nr:YeeE/YedE family protein [Aquabacterium sp. J223]UUX94686.1 YeeE/YedE family protein [Aquabacterium sp. J223]
MLWAAFGLAFAFGAIAQRTHFCTMGAVADIVSMGDWTRMRMWVLAMAVAMLCFSGGVASGVLDATKTLYGGPGLLWLSTLVGGLLFGIGMVLGSGCGSKTLIRLGGGNLKSLVVFLVIGLAAFATLRGLTAVWRVQTVDRAVVALPTGQDLPSLLTAGAGGSVQVWAAALGGGLALALVAWVLRRPEGRSGAVWLGGVGVGLAVGAMWWVSGTWGHVAEDPSTLQEAFLATNSQRMEAFSFVAPIAYTLDWLLFYSDAAKRLTVGIVSVVGVVLGSAAVALASRSFRWEGFANAGDLGRHLAAGLLMGVGGVTALGCTVGQGISGLSTLSLGSVLALAGILAGGWGTLRWQVWRLEREA